MDHKQVIVIRKDLKMRRGKEIAQGAHASLKTLLDVAIERHYMTDQGLTPFLCIPLTDAIQPWLQGLFKKIAVSVDSEAELLAVYEKAKATGVLTALIRDSGLTEFNGVPTYTAVAIGPDTPAKIDAITGNLKLL